MAKRKSTAKKTAPRTDAASAETNTRTSAASPEAAETPKEARARAQAMFDKADEDGKAELIQEASLSRAARGY
jgi:cell division septum initiation protein DivIVA